MSNIYRAPFTVAVAQVTPVFLDQLATLEKACEFIVDAGRAGARLIVFMAVPCSCTNCPLALSVNRSVKH
jgi:predicted amidohydrolase